MRYCPHCLRINQGWPERCRFCGRTWNYRICRRGHVNPSDSVFCGECGSVDLSTPILGSRFINRVFGFFGSNSRTSHPLVYSLLCALLLCVFLAPGTLLPFLIPLALLFIAYHLASRNLPFGLDRLFHGWLRSIFGIKKSKQPNSRTSRGRRHGAEP